MSEFAFGGWIVISRKDDWKHLRARDVNERFGPELLK
jgi:hypothetical protein